MNEQTNPVTGVEQPSIEDRMQSFISQSEQDQGGEAKPAETQSAEVQQEQPEGQAQTEESAEPASETDAPVEQPAVDAFEIVHNGQQVKLTREETIKYAMQGFDYTQKTQAVAEQSRMASHALQRIAQVEQIVPQIIGQVAEVKALEAQLAPYQNVNWPQYLAQNGTDAYAQARAQFDALDREYRNAVVRNQQAYGMAKQQLDAVKNQNLAAEDSRLSSVIPEWKDQAKKEAGKAEVLRYLTSQGVSPALIDAKLDTAEAVAIAYKAMQWDKFQGSKASKVNQLRTAPPITVPGAAQSSSAKADKEKQLQQRLRKTGSREDAMAVLLNRMK